MTRIIKGLTGGTSREERVLKRWNPTGFTAPGASASYDPATRSMVLTRSPEREAAISRVSGAYDARANAFAGLRGTLTPQFEGIRTALRENTMQRIEEIRSAGRTTSGNIREGLARRRLAGSSFQASEVAAAEAEFARKEDIARAEGGLVEAQVGAETYLREFEINRDLVKEQFDSSIAGATAVLQDLNMDTAMIAQLSGLASQLFADNIKAQSEAQAAQSAAFEEWFASERGYAHDFFSGGGGGGSGIMSMFGG